MALPDTFLKGKKEFGEPSQTFGDAFLMMNFSWHWQAELLLLLSYQLVIPECLLSAELSSLWLLLKKKGTARVHSCNHLPGSLISIPALECCDELTISLKTQRALLQVVVTTASTPFNQMQLLQRDFWTHTAPQHNPARSVGAI